MAKKINRILLNGVDYTSDVQGIHDISLNYFLDEESRAVVYTTSSEIVFKFDAYTLIRDTFFNGDGCENKIVATLILGCCGESALTFEINFRTITDHCPAICEITSRLQERTTDQTAYECLLNSIYWQDADGQQTWLQHLNNYDIPKYQYCGDPKGISDLLTLLFTTLITQICIIAIASATVFTAIAIAAACTAFTILMNTLFDLFKFSDCGKFHPATPLNAIIDYAMLRCGLTFVSNTIFSVSPYSDTHLIQCQYVEGKENPEDWVPDNAANLNFIQFVDELEPVFNSDFRIRNNEFIFERKDEFLRNLPLLGDLDQLYTDGCAKKPPCYKYINQAPAALGRFEYTPDALDSGGNEVTNLVYNDIVDWNTPPREFAKGQDPTIANFSVMNYVGMGPDSVNADIDGGLVGKWYLKGGVSSQLKLVIHNPASDINDAKPLGYTDSIGAPTNFPLWFDELNADPELYKNFHFIKDPRNLPCPAEADDYEFAPDNFCELVTLIQANGPDVRVQTNIGDMKPEEIDINFDQQTLTLKGLKTFYVAP